MNTLVKTLSGVQSDAAPESRRFAVRDWFVAAVVRGFPPVLGLVLFCTGVAGHCHGHPRIADTSGDVESSGRVVCRSVLQQWPE